MFELGSSVRRRAVRRPVLNRALVLGRRPSAGQNLPSVSLPVEELWVPSAHVARGARAAHLDPGHDDPAVGGAARAPASFSRRAGPCGWRVHVCSSVDYASGFERKNPLAVIEAFRAAFSSDEHVRLVVACANGERDPRRHAELVAAVGEDPAIEVRDCDASGSEIEALTAACDCYVSLHRAEAFGRDLATAMWFGKPVIATGYSGNLDFMTADNSMLVEFALVPVGPGADPYPADGQWADPSVEHAAALMQARVRGPGLSGAARSQSLRRHQAHPLHYGDRADDLSSPGFDLRHWAPAPQP